MKIKKLQNYRSRKKLALAKISPKKKPITRNLMATRPRSLVLYKKAPKINRCCKSVLTEIETKTLEAVPANLATRKTYHQINRVHPN